MSCDFGCVLTELPANGRRSRADALSLIPAAAFAALVANDLIQPDLYAASPAAILPVALSSVAVLVVARKSGSLLWCAVTGMAAYALLGMVF